MKTAVTRRITQRDLARVAKVSHTTVSLALRGHPSIPAATRDRIARLANAQGYRPDPILAALNAYRIGRVPSKFQGTLAWLTSFPTAEGWRSLIQSGGYFSGACRQAEHLGYKLEEFWMGDPKLPSARATHILQTRGIRGIIVAPLPVPGGSIHLDWSAFSAVALGYSLGQPQLHVVSNHQFSNMKQLVSHLNELGYRRVGLAMPASIDERVAHNYVGGFLVAQQEHFQGRSLPRPLIAENFDRPTFRKWFLRSRPDAIITAASRVYHVLEWLKTEGLRVPQDVGVAVPIVPFGNHAISGIDENALNVGAMAVDTVVGMIHRNETGVPPNSWRILAEGTWFPGCTAGLARAYSGVRKAHPQGGE